MSATTSSGHRGARSRRAALALLGALSLAAPLSCAAPRSSAAAPGSSTAAPTPHTASSTATTSAPSSTTPRSTISPTTTTSRSTTSPTRTSAAPTGPRATRSCAALADSLTVNQQIGQLVMMGISSGGLTSRQATILSQGHIGSVILLGNSTAGAAPIRRLSKKVHGVGGRPSGVGVLLTVDQEGGKVQRLRGSGFDRIPSARSQARLSSSSLQTKAARWARQLRAAGVDANLAPVADVVPTSMEHSNLPIGALQRGYGPKPAVVAAKVAAFNRGMHQGGISTAVKHFPGLGRVRGNTDYSTHVVDTVTTRHDRALQGFRAAAAGKVDMVMVSSAFYSKIDRSHRAAFSTTVINGMIRKDLTFSGVVISDDLAAAAVRDYTPGRRAITFLASGGDLLIVGDSKLAPSMVSALRKRARTDAKFRAQLEVKATRVLRMKAARGLTSCR